MSREEERQKVREQKRKAIEKELPKVADRIIDHDNSLTGLYSDRLSLWKQAAKLGMKHREIADLSSVKETTVSVALHRARI